MQSAFGKQQGVVVRFPMLELWIVGCLTVSLVLALGWSLRHAGQTAQTFDQHYRALEQSCADITYLDEVLTMSACMSAATGDPKWEQRYLVHVDLLDDAIVRLHELTLHELDSQAKLQIDQANTILVELEARAFGLVSEGKQPQALALLSSDQYLENKRIYSKGVDAYLGKLRSEVSVRMQRETTQSEAGLMALGPVLLVLAVIWLSVGRSMRKYAEARERALQEAADQRDLTAEVSNSKARFLANLSYGIRTPMNAIVGYSDLLLEPDQSQSTFRRHIQNIKGSTDHLLQIVNELLGISETESASGEMEMATFKPCELASNFTKLTRPRAQEKGLELILDCQCSLPEKVVMDVTRLREILLHLLSNAVKFTEEGRIVLSLHASSGASPFLFFEVRDTGVGIAKDLLESVLRPSMQAGEAGPKNYGESESGLHLSVKQAERMGGELYVESIVGEGSCFSLVLPYELPAPPSPDDLLELPKAALPASLEEDEQIAARFPKDADGQSLLS